MDRSKTVVRWVGFAVSLIATALSGWTTAFSVYALALKDTFGYTQTQVEIVPSVGMWGFALALIQSVIYGKFGHKVSYTVILVLSPFSISLLYIGTIYQEFFHNQAFLVGIFQLLVNLSNNMLQILVCEIAVQNFDEKYIGKIIGSYSSSKALGKIFYAGVFNTFFAENLGGFFLFTGILWTIVYGLTFVFHQPKPREDDVLMLELPKHSDNDAAIEHAVVNERSPLKNMLSSVYFHLVFWSAILFYGVFFTFMSNLTSIADSANSDNPLVLVYIFASVMAIGRFLFGSIYDYLARDVFGSLLLVVCYSFFLSGVLISLVWFDQTTLFVSAFLVGLSSSAGGVLPLSMLLSRFGRSHYTILRCVLLVLVAAFTSFFQLITGLIYDADSVRQNQGSNLCVGVTCFYWSLVMLLSVSLVPLLIQLSYCIAHVVLRWRKGFQ